MIKVGDVFGYLTVIGHYNGKKNHWNCRCICGAEYEAWRHELLGGDKKSCSCRQNKRPRKHGHASNYGTSTEYRIWHGIKARCSNPNNRGYHNYGGRGITVCERWSGEHGFENFFADVGRRPSLQHSLDRVDNNGNYEPSNWRWATRKEQNNNQRVKKALESFSGEEFLAELRRRMPEYELVARLEG